MAERLQKLLARTGLMSRRQAERWIAAGRVTLNGEVATLGACARETDRIVVDGQSVRGLECSPERRVLLYHKPAGELCTRSDPQGRRTLFDHLPSPPQGRWIPIGRLDCNTTGLILLTTDGELAHALMHPSRSIPREYYIRLRGNPPQSVLTRLQQGIELADGWAHLTAVQRGRSSGGHSALYVTLESGRNREVRRLFEAVGYPVSRMLRIRFGPIGLPRELKPGMSRELSETEVALCEQAAGVTKDKRRWRNAISDQRRDRSN